MPTYVYRCKDCEHQFEAFQRMSDEPLTDCPECKGQVARLLFPVGIMFKGSGFHVNDYPSSRATGGNGSRPENKPEPAKETAAASKD